MPGELHQVNLRELRRKVPKLLGHLDRAARVADAEWIPASRWPGLCVAPSDTRCEQIVYITKSNGVMGVALDDDRVTGHTTILFRYGCVTPAIAKRVFAHSRLPALPSDFVGDLH